MSSDVQDDFTIPNDALLWRRIQPGSWEFDGNIGRIRPWSNQFDDDELSVVLSSPDRVPSSILVDHSGYALVALTAGLARELGQIVVRDPVDNEPDHCLVIGPKSKGVQRRLARSATWIIGPNIGDSDSDL